MGKVVSTFTDSGRLSAYPSNDVESSYSSLMDYNEAIHLPTLEERSAALIALGRKPSVRISRLIARVRVWLAYKIAPGYFDE